MPMTIRRADAADLESLVPLFDAYRQFYGQSTDMAGAAAYLKARLKRHEAVLFLAMLDGRAIGFTLLYPSFSSVAMQETFILNDLFVTAQARGRGAGLALLAAASRHAHECAVRCISLETAENNLPAQNLYRKAGWRRDQTQRFHLDTQESAHP